MKQECSVSLGFRIRHVLGVLILMLTLVWLQAHSRALAEQTPGTAGPADPMLIEDLVAANRILYQEGIVDGFGHVSVRHNLDPSRFLLSRSLAPELVTVEDLIEYDLEGVPLNLAGRDQYSERFIHAEIYTARPDVQSVVHNHSPSVVGRIPDFPVTRSHPLASWPSAANSSIGRTYRKTVGEESLQRSPVASR